MPLNHLPFLRRWIKSCFTAPHTGLMTFLAEGGSIDVTGTVWTNKATLRMSMYLHFTDVNGRKGDNLEWGVPWPGGWPRTFLEKRFPWADVIVTVKGHDNEESLYQALHEDHGWAGQNFGWEDLLSEENIEGWEFKGVLALGELEA
jgi:hypothetical protein